MGLIRSVGWRRKEVMRLQETRWVNAPLEEAFEFTADFSNIADWDPGVTSSKKVTEGPVGLGTEFDLEVRFGLRTIPMRYVITEYQPNSRVVLVGRGELLQAVDEIVFSREDNMTRIDYTADLTFPNSLRFLSPLISLAAAKVGRRALDGLAAALNR
ncbi:MAG: polyketide cyclase [Acidimicrobiia bacterium]|nr:MAG: polyketide cyclase [Acidimicrobiia bacterium]